MTQRKVVAAWFSTVPHRVLDDGSEWVWNVDCWQRVFPPLPPEALGEVVGEGDKIKVGDEVILDNRVPVIVRRVDGKLGAAHVMWGFVSATCNLSRLAKVPR